MKIKTEKLKKIADFLKNRNRKLILLKKTKNSLLKNRINRKFGAAIRSFTQINRTTEILIE